MSLQRIGERFVYVGPETNDLQHGEAGVAWPLDGFDDPDSFEFQGYAFYPDGDSIGYYVHAQELQWED